MFREGSRLRLAVFGGENGLSGPISDMPELSYLYSFTSRCVMITMYNGSGAFDSRPTYILTYGHGMNPFDATKRGSLDPDQTRCATWNDQNRRWAHTCRDPCGTPAIYPAAGVGSNIATYHAHAKASQASHNGTILARQAMCSADALSIAGAPSKQKWKSKNWGARKKEALTAL